MSTEVVAIDACIHPEITLEVKACSDGYTVYCSTCHKKIIIPDITLARNENSLIGIITEVFGNEVGQRIARWT